MAAHRRRGLQWRNSRPALLALLALLVSIGIAVPLVGANAEGNALGTVTPKLVTDPDRVSVVLGMRFSSTTGGTVSGVRFYKGARNTGVHVGTLWTGGGAKLASVRFSKESRTGWQQARFAKPVSIAAGRTYVVSYVAPRGGYSADVRGFDSAMSNGTLRVPAGAGVYRYGSSGFPTQNYLNSNYYVDVLYTASPVAEATPPVSTPTPTPTAPSPSPTTPTAPPSGSSGSGALSLPVVPSDGGNAYWRNFPKASAAGWADPSFFPIGAWWSVASSAQEVASDRSLGLNTVVVTNPSADYGLLEQGGMFYVGSQIPGATDASRNWVGSFLDDEVDGRFAPAEGLREMQRLANEVPVASTGRFRYANYTSSLVTYDRDDATRNAYVNNYTDVVSLDQYFYSVPQCDWGANALRWETPTGQNPIVPANCRTASSYGKTVDLLREADATDGKLQPIWQFVEVVGDYKRLTGDQVQGAAMASVIHGANGIVWFPQSFEGGCETGNAFRTWEYEKSACLAPQVAGVKKVNLFIQSLAPVINSPTYQWKFGTGTDTMLKVKDGSAYVFAMTSDGGTGSRSFALPAGVKGTTVEVVGENRTLPVSGGSFTDSFAAESSYHVYKISLN